MLRLKTPLHNLLRFSYINKVIRTKVTSVDRHSKGGEYATLTGSIEPNEGVEETAGTTIKKLTAREPLVKNFFTGIVDKELLGYPEVITREDMSTLQNQVLLYKDVFKEQSNASIEATYNVDASVLDSIKQFGLYGLNVPANYDGKGYEWSASLIASEPESEFTSIALGLSGHRAVIDLLRDVATQQQQQKYFSQLASGDLVATEAIFEYETSEENYFNTAAHYNSQLGFWTLSGEKAYVVTGPLPKGSRQLFLVVAQTKDANVVGNSGRGTSIFLVESDQSGVQLLDPHITFGCKAAQIRRVKFDEVKLSEQNIVGLVHNGNKSAELLIRAGRLRYSLLGLTMAKNLLTNLVQHSIETKQCGTQLKDMETVRVQLSKAMCTAYAVESMIYLTAGLLDEFHKQDVTLEAAITKYYTLTHLLNLARQNVNIIGTKSLHAGQNTELQLRNAAHLYSYGESMDTLSLFIALTGLQHAGHTMHDAVRKARNPLFHPGYIFAKFLETSSIEHPNTKMRLGDNLHPSLEPAALCIEQSVARLQMSVDLMFTRHGNSVVERHSEMQRLAEISSTIYAMFASAARASRSYCIGLPLADHELLTATTICTHGRDYVKTLCIEICNGHYVNNDNNLLRMASQIIKSKGYFAVHPLTFNF